MEGATEGLTEWMMKGVKEVYEMVCEVLFFISVWTLLLANS